LDLKEAVQIDGIGLVNFVNIYDIGSGVMILSYPFVVGVGSSNNAQQKAQARVLTWKDIRCALREAFSQWGFPLRVRTDRGHSLSGAKRAYSPLCLVFGLLDWVLSIDSMRNLVVPSLMEGLSECIGHWLIGFGRMLILIVPKLLGLPFGRRYNGSTVKL
jgi:hypothetical protein